ncbi:MAG: tyrosine--tRNA ligase, partial [Methanomicrobiales archaeon]|nr:tyrosine--tRNA ligase [Methanomicrobiales archaeon]MDD1648091.1 tyrosine--tRNA ligase [Methanomicrobiales archaeon]
SSSKGNYISVADSEEAIKKKIGKAFCPPAITDNPILQILQHHVFPRKGSVTVKRPAKFGGDRTFSGYQDLEDAYASGQVHPMDLKNATASCLSDVLAPVRDRLG